MPRKKKVVRVELETIWEVPDALWEKLRPILDEAYPPAKTGRKRIDFRKAINGIIFRLRSGCQWNHLPKIFGDDSSVHRWFQCWVSDGILERLWAVLISDCEELGGVEWKWQAADGCMGKSRFGGEKRGETRPIAARPGPRKAFLSMAVGDRLG